LRIERLLFAGALGKLLLELLTRLLEQTGDVFRAEQIEFATGRHQGHEIFSRQLVAEGILDCGEGIGRWSPGGHRANRETFAGTEAEYGILGHRHFSGLACLNLAALDQVEKADFAGIRPKDLAPGRMKRQLRLVGEQLQRLGRHLVERRMQFEKILDAACNTTASLLPQFHFCLADCLFFGAHENPICSSKSIV